MAYCYDHAIPHSEFLEWDQEDRAKVAAYGMERAAQCTRCGTADWEWAEDPYVYAPMTRVCAGCRVRDLMQSDVSGDAPGVSVVLVPKETAARIEDAAAQARASSAIARAAREKARAT